jgi:hypothetical protein
VDATAMYTNIDTTTGTQAFEHLFKTYKTQIPHNFPKEFFLKILKGSWKTIFLNLEIHLGSKHNTAMGTQTTPLYSIITFGYHENVTILKNFKSNLLYYRRFIDDIFGIWSEEGVENDTQHDNIDQWKNFKTQLNSFGSLNWNVEPLMTSTTFLDLTITI